MGRVLRRTFAKLAGTGIYAADGVGPIVTVVDRDGCNGWLLWAAVGSTGSPGGRGPGGSQFEEVCRF